MELPPTILPPGSSGVPNPAGALTGQSALDQDAFLQMLVTQLNNQDPLNPLQGHEFAAQLAQFTSVEQLLSLNQTLAGQGELFALLADTMGASLQAQGDMLGILSESMNRSAASNLIGMSVDVPGTAVYLSGADPVPVAYELDAPAEAVHIRIRDENGVVVSTLSATGAEAGRQNVAWDGTDADGHPLPPGAYTMEVEAFDADGQPVGVTPLMQGIVDRVSFGPDGVVVWVNGQPVPYTDIRSIGWPSSDAPLPDEPAGPAPDGAIDTPTPHTVPPVSTIPPDGASDIPTPHTGTF